MLILSTQGDTTGLRPSPMTVQVRNILRAKKAVSQESRDIMFGEIV